MTEATHQHKPSRRQCRRAASALEYSSAPGKAARSDARISNAVSGSYPQGNQHPHMVLVWVASNAYDAVGSPCHICTAVCNRLQKSQKSSMYGYIVVQLLGLEGAGYSRQCEASYSIYQEGQELWVQFCDLLGCQMNHGAADGRCVQRLRRYTKWLMQMKRPKMRISGRTTGRSCFHSGSDWSWSTKSCDLCFVS